MGGDGGTIPDRAALVDMYAGERKPGAGGDVREARFARTQQCCLSQKPLEGPLVCDELGNLFRKEELLRKLLDKTLSTDPVYAPLSHIARLRDVFEVKPTANPAFDASDSYAARFVCPVTQLEFNGKHKFVAIRSTGVVLSAAALDALRGQRECPVTGKPFTDADIVVLCAEGDDLAAAKQRVAAAAAAAKARHADSASKKRPAAGASTGGAARVDEAGHGTAEADSSRKRREATAAMVEDIKLRPRTVSDLPRTAPKQADAIQKTLKAQSAVYSSLFTSSSSKR